MWLAPNGGIAAPFPWRVMLPRSSSFENFNSNAGPRRAGPSPWPPFGWQPLQDDWYTRWPEAVSACAAPAGKGVAVVAVALPGATVGATSGFAASGGATAVAAGADVAPPANGAGCSWRGALTPTFHWYITPANSTPTITPTNIIT